MKNYWKNVSFVIHDDQYCFVKWFTVRTVEIIGIPVSVKFTCTEIERHFSPKSRKNEPNGKIRLSFMWSNIRIETQPIRPHAKTMTNSYFCSCPLSRSIVLFESACFDIATGTRQNTLNFACQLIDASNFIVKKWLNSFWGFQRESIGLNTPSINLPNSTRIRH